ncbi:MAG: ABC transporter ATP-binding protein [Coprococcus catus]|nr:ABC transporter ATP-binding protein [Coprococcus catus]
MTQITCRDLTIGYGSRIILKHLNFTVNEGDYLCIIGENGSGKSSLMRTILNLQNPISGQILYDHQIQQNGIGYLPQQTSRQKDFPASVREIVLSGCDRRSGFHPFYHASDKKKAVTAMQQLKITHLAHRCYRELSGGQQQRVLLARALCATEKILFLDEPVSGLDPEVTADFYALIRRLNRREGITILMISHDLQATAADATHILHLGTPFFYGLASDYFHSEVHTHDRLI